MCFYLMWQNPIKLLRKPGNTLEHNLPFGISVKKDVKLYGTALEQKLIRGVSAIVSNSFEGADALKRTYGLSDKDITVINNGIISLQARSL